MSWNLHQHLGLNIRVQMLLLMHTKQMGDPLC
jgi:hypothetical protein